MAIANQTAWPTKAPRYQSLDMWRGLACLLMVVFHATMQVTAAYQNYAPSDGLVERSGQKLVMVTARTWVGVPIFFVISGYCIMATLDSARRKQRGLGDYILRRVRRIYPAYWIGLAIAVAAITITESLGYTGMFSEGRFTIPLPWQMSWQQWLGNLTLTETWRPLVSDAPMALLLPNTWTLCYEEQFYLLAGLLLWFMPRHIFTGMAVFTILAMVVRVVAHRLGVELFGTFLDGRWLILAVGIMVYYRVNYASRTVGHLIHALLLLGLLTSHLGPARMLDWEPTKDLERFIAFGFGLTISLLHSWDRVIMRHWIAQGLSYCGSFSYSIYLMHPLVTKAISYSFFRQGYVSPWFTLLLIVPTCLIVSLLVSRLFYHLVERRFTNSDSPTTSLSTLTTSPLTEERLLNEWQGTNTQPNPVAIATSME
jgi:peptidoglycan/LPS O-acetylase OafA/YrhL